jgi:hypothetical protein
MVEYAKKYPTYVCVSDIGESAHGRILRYGHSGRVPSRRKINPKHTQHMTDIIIPETFY